MCVAGDVMFDCNGQYRVVSVSSAVVAICVCAACIVFFGAG